MFTPGILVVIILHVLFINLEQGRDIVRQTFESGWRMFFLGLSTIFLAYVTWYGARLRALALWERVRLHPRIRKLMPRLLGHCTYMAALVGMVRMGDGLTVWTSESPVWSVIALDLVWFFVLRWVVWRFMRAVGDRTEWMMPILWGLHLALIVLAAALALFGTDRVWPMLIIALMQGVFAALVNVRSKWLRALNTEEQKVSDDRSKENWLDRLFPRERNIGSAGQEEMLPYSTEKRYFWYFNLLCAVVVAFLFVLWSVPETATFAGAFAVAWFSVGLLHGFFHLQSWLTRGTGVPFALGLFMFVVFVSGRRDDHHRVAVIGTQHAPASRGTFDARWNDWKQRHVRNDSDTTAIPIVFVLADGGASRSGYWVGRVLERLHRSDTVFRDALFSLSGASGGAVGIASYYQLAASGAYDGPLPNDGFGDTLALGGDMLSTTLAHMLGPDLINLLSSYTHDRAHALELSLERSDGLWKKPVRELFAEAESLRRPILCLNTTRMDDGRPGVISSVSMDRVSGRIDVLAALSDSLDMHLSTAAVLSSRFPYVSPAGFLEWGGLKHYFVDGGYFDNSGAGATIEMLLRIEELARYGKENEEKWLKRLRPIVVHISNSAPPRVQDEGSVHELANDLAAPFLTVLGTYASQTNINDVRLAAHLDRVFEERAEYITVNLYDQAPRLEFSMSWSMSALMRDSVDQLALRHPEVDHVLRKLH